MIYFFLLWGASPKHSRRTFFFFFCRSFCLFVKQKEHALYKQQQYCYGWKKKDICLHQAFVSSIKSIKAATWSQELEGHVLCFLPSRGESCFAFSELLHLAIVVAALLFFVLVCGGQQLSSSLLQKNKINMFKKKKSLLYYCKSNQSSVADYLKRDLETICCLLISCRRTLTFFTSDFTNRFWLL